MPVLRSRTIPPTSSSKTLVQTSNLQPPTPSKSSESPPIQTANSTPLPPRRRSLRLSSKQQSSIICPTTTTKRLRNGKLVNNKDLINVRVSESDLTVDETPKIVKRRSSHCPEQVNMKPDDHDWLSLRPGTNVIQDDGRKAEEDDINGSISVEETSVRVSDLEFTLLQTQKNLNIIKTSEKEKGKGKAILIEESDDFEDRRNKEEDFLSLIRNDEELKKRRSRRLTREEKGKGVMSKSGYDLDLNMDVDSDSEVDVDSEIEDSMNELDVEAIENEFESVAIRERTLRIKERYKQIARRNAFKFAHFNVQEEESNRVESEAEPEVAPAENLEDWPGPFSTAMKILRDREKNLTSQVRNSSTVKGGFPLVSWTPKGGRDPNCRVPPSLQSMCLNILAKNVDAITSLNYVPDSLRNKLSQLLCNTRKMNPHFLNLLLDGSPAEIRLADCSWLEEGVFEKSFEACDFKNLTVLQLDLCGHCVSDSSLRKALVPKGLQALTTISLKGACRISDVGLAALVSAAPALRSINISQCSLLTDVGIDSIANSVGSILQELYLDDCDTLDAMRILPILKRLQHLEVLSLRGIVSVSDKFMRELIGTNGQNMKELVLANCVNLTDSSLKLIAEKCSQLCVLDLSYLGKLTDIGMAHLTNCGRRIQDLKLCRSPFSDDSIAAFLETCGESLKELSLNNILKVGQNTTISLARRCKNLESLDLSWCRRLTDEALGLIADSCLSLRLLKLFGCTQVTNVFVDGHSNPNLHIVGLQLTPILEHIKRPDFQQGPLHYSVVPSL